MYMYVAYLYINIHTHIVNTYTQMDTDTDKANRTKYKWFVKDLLVLNWIKGILVLSSSKSSINLM